MLKKKQTLALFPYNPWDWYNYLREWLIFMGSREVNIESSHRSVMAFDFDGIQCLQTDMSE